MTDQILFANAQIVLPGEVILGHLIVRDGLIATITQGATIPAGAIDCGGDFLCPGLIELHTDNLEQHISPRPRVNWPHNAAILAHDAELAGCGISTVFDALRVGSVLSEQGGYDKYARAMADEILAMRDAGALRISHLLHLRAETCSETLIEELDTFGPMDRIGIVSLMDHTPGQRQFANLSKFSQYVMGKHAMDQAAFEAHCTYLEGLYAKFGAPHQAATVAAARRYGATLASHDDTTVAHVMTSRDQGVTVAEFPTTYAAAAACREVGIDVIMGAPNLIRGGSHSGNVAAADLADAGLLDILSSDYVPAALLMGAVQLGQRWGNMARGLGTVTQAPARAVGLMDRGQIAVGLRADLLRFGLVGQVPAPRGLWVHGTRVA
jgi:alpha-D-ribose 1-methylphosphonate 5-triphosphate diphosphatase